MISFKQIVIALALVRYLHWILLSLLVIMIVVVSLVAAGFLLIGLDGLRRRSKTEHSLKIITNRHFDKKSYP